MNDDLKLPALTDSHGIIALLGIYQTKLQALRQSGLPTTGKSNTTRYPVAACVKWFIEYTVNEALKAQQERSGIDDKDSLTLRKMTASAMLDEIKVAKELDGLISMDDYEAAQSREQAIIRAGLLSFPARVSPFLVALKTELEARETMAQHVNDLMQQMAVQIDEPELADDDDEDDDA